METVCQLGDLWTFAVPEMPVCSLTCLWAVYTVWVPQICGDSAGDGVLVS